MPICPSPSFQIWDSEQIAKSFFLYIFLFSLFLQMIIYLHVAFFCLQIMISHVSNNVSLLSLSLPPLSLPLLSLPLQAFVFHSLFFPSSLVLHFFYLSAAIFFHSRTISLHIFQFDLCFICFSQCYSFPWSLFLIFLPFHFRVRCK